MKQETVNPTQGSTFNASFQQKSAGLSLVITGSVAAYFMARAWPLRPAAVAGDTIPAGYGGLVLTTVVLLIVAQIVLQTVLAVGAGAAAATAAEQMATLKARRNAYFVLAAAVLTAVYSVFVGALTPFDTANVMVVGLALAEIVQSASQLFYARG